MYGGRNIVPGKEQETKQTRKAQNKGTINREGKHEERDRERERESERKRNTLQEPLCVVSCSWQLVLSVQGFK